MTCSRQVEIDRNYDFFQRHLSGWLTEHRDEYALLRNRQVVGFFKLPGDAYREGLKRFEDTIFSIQQVRSEPIELGHFAIDPR